MKRTLLFLGISPIIITMLAYQTSYAQMVDYSSLEAIVGEPVTTSATGTPQREEDVAANMTIITADQIRQSGSRDIPEILSRVPGLDVLHEGVDTFDVGVRGYQQAMSSRLLVLIDGRQVFLDDYSRTAWENLPVNVDDIRQIEVVMGPASALFGSNASGGVINIITYNPLFDNNNVASVTYGTQDHLTEDVTKTLKISDNAGIKVSAGGVNGEEFTTPRMTGPNTEGAISTNPQHQYATLSAVFQTTPELLTNLESTYSRSNGTEAYYNGQLAGVGIESYSMRGGLSWQTPYGTIKSNNYFNSSRVDNNEVSTTLPYYNDTNNTIVSQLEDQFKIGKDNTFRISGEYQHKEFNLDAPESGLVDTTIDENNFALSGMWLWQMTSQLAWTNALREDHLGLGLSGTLYQDDPFTNASYDHSLNELSANSGLVYHATDKDTYRLTFARGIEMPSLLDYGFNTINLNMRPTASNATGATEREGNPDLDATVSTNYELDYERKITSLFSTAKFAIFCDSNADIIAPFPTITSSKVTTVAPVTRLREPINIGSSDGLGGEIELAGKSPSGFRWDISYSYASVQDNIMVLQDFGYENSAPLNHFRVLLGYSTGPWEFDSTTQYLTSRMLYRLSRSRVESPDYASLGGRIGYKVTDAITVSLSGTDLTQANTQESPYPAIERQIFLGTTVRF